MVTLLQIYRALIKDREPNKGGTSPPPIFVATVCTVKTENYSGISTGEYFPFSWVTMSYLFLRVLAVFLYSCYLLF